jgi:hypothetical protein
MNPGVYPGLSMAEYLAMPAVSASLLRTIVSECPRAAWHKSYLNPHAPADDSTDGSNAGTIAHSILLEGSEACVEIGSYADFKKNEAKEWRDKVNATGKIAILEHKMPPIRAMVAEARRFLDDEVRTAEPAVWQAFQPGGGESETTIVWDEDGTLCRMRPDRMSADHRLIVDYKTGGTTSEPDNWGRTQMVRMGYYMSAAFYRIGIEATFGVSPAYVFLVQEQDPPYLCSLVGVDPHAFELGESKVAHGLDIWQRCMATGKWPGYTARVVYPEIPAWEQAAWEERQEIDKYEQS